MCIPPRMTCAHQRSARAAGGRRPSPPAMAPKQRAQAAAAPTAAQPAMEAKAASAAPSAPAGSPSAEGGAEKPMVLWVADEMLRVGDTEARWGWGGGGLPLEVLLFLAPACVGGLES